MFHKSLETYSRRSLRYRQLIQSARTITTEPKSKAAEVPNPRQITTDMVGPPDTVSNLRPIVFKQPLNETKLEKLYRYKRMETQEWNQKFWTEHNSRFFKDREAYLKKNLPEGKDSMSADEMSVFYKAFLDKNWKGHVSYNIEWYRRNFEILGLALRVKFWGMFKKNS